MDSRNQRLKRGTVLVLDALLVSCAMCMAWLLHRQLRDSLSIFKEPPQFGHYAAVAYLTLPLWLTLIRVHELDLTFERLWSPFGLVIDLLKLHATGFVALSVLLFITQQTINRVIVVTFLVCSFCLMYLERALLGRWAKFQHERGSAQQRIVLVCQFGPDVEQWLANQQRADFPPKVVGILADADAPAGWTSAPPRIGRAGDLKAILHAEAVDQVIFFPPFNHPGESVEAFRICESCGVQAAFAVDVMYRYPVAPEVVLLGDRPFLTFDAIARRPEALVLKHGFDFVVALLVALVVLPVIGLIAVAILISAGRPILFSQERVGLHGRRFRMLKFRTMVQNAEVMREGLAAQNEMSGPVFKIARDPRVTSLGAVLRRWSLDELPQLFNVLVGSMSLVGPRPLPVSEQQEIEGWYRRRLSMKPGITGLWQVSGRSNIDFDEWMKLDLRYVEQWSFRLDVWILLRTPRAVLSRRGAH